MTRNVFLLAALLFSANALAHDEGIPGGPDSHAPIGVMGDHTHGADEVMFSYRFMRMEMEEIGNGTNDVSVADVLADYMVAPLSMTTDMHMFGAMYAPSDRLTLMAMLPYLERRMDHVTRMGMGFEAESRGIGDVGVSALWLLSKSEGRSLHATLGLSLPTGAIDERGDTPMADDVVLPYPMQLGSGTYDAKLGLTWRAMEGRASWGVQGTATVRTGENDRGYRLGNRIDATAWAAWRFNRSLSGSLRLAGSDWQDIEGADAALNPMMVPTADPALRAGTRIDAGVGFNFRVAEGVLERHRLALEYLLPVHQDLDGPQLQSDGMLMLGWQYDFHL